jgi:hypothetical protein
MKRFGIVATTVALAIMATTAVASAQMGVAVMWDGNGLAPVMALPITIGEGMVLQPKVGILWVADDGPTPGTEFMIGASFEKHMMEGDTRPLFGVHAAVDAVSPKEGDSYTNFNLGVFIGGTAKLAENVSIVGQWGPTLTMVGEKGSVTGKSYSTLHSSAALTLRWWLWGNK